MIDNNIKMNYNYTMKFKMKQNKHTHLSNQGLSMLHIDIWNWLKSRESIGKTLKGSYVAQTIREMSEPLHKFRRDTRSLLYSYVLRKSDKPSKMTPFIQKTPSELRSQLENDFEPGMTWENKGKWDVDHGRPLAKLNTVEEILNAYHHSNLKPMWDIDNIKKGAK